MTSGRDLHFLGMFHQELPLGGAIYGSDCMVVCNDWHSALVPMFIHADRTATGWGECFDALRQRLSSFVQTRTKLIDAQAFAFQNVGEEGIALTFVLLDLAHIPPG